MDIRHILCPTDRSEASAHAVDQAVVIAGWHKARTTALHVILHIAAEESSALIIIGVRGCNALDMTLFGSTTNQVVRVATCPVLTRRR